MEKKIKFATAILDFSRKRGGAERYLVDLCTRMAGDGFEVHVYAERWEDVEKGIYLHSVKTIPFPRSLRLLSFAVRATRAIERGDYDVSLGVGNTLQADVLQPHGGVHWAWFWRSLRAYDNPMLWTIKFLGRVVSPKQWTQGYIENAPYKKKPFYKIIAISDMVKQDIMQWYGIPENRIEVVYNGVDTGRFHPGNRQYREGIRKRYNIGEEFVILFVSNNFRMKGLGYLIKALAEIKKSNPSPYKCLVLGRDRKTPYVRLAEKFGISQEVIFAGSTDEPERYYGAADVLVHPTFYDACSLTVLEAMASGLSVITTASNGASGVINHGKEGWIVQEPRNIDQLITAINFFLNKEVRYHASSEGKGNAESHSAKANLERMMGIFREIAGAIQ